jgi:predicted glycosyltransferase
MTERVLFHLQHLLGIGHTQRGALLVRAMLEQGLDVTVLLGGEPIDADWGNAALIQLPWARWRDANFENLVDEHNRTLDDTFHQRRRALALAVYERVQPSVLLLESFPFGRRAFRTELMALIAAARAARPRCAVVTSLRDIVVARADPAWALDVAGTVQRDIDVVLVHGDPALAPLEVSFAATQQIADRLRYTGYVAPARTATNDGAPGDEVLVSVGGGAAGAALLQAALRARPLSRLGKHPWRLIAGPNMPAGAYQGLAQNLPPGVVLERFRCDFWEVLRRCHLSVSQAGYNTILDLLQAGRPALVVPFAGGGENEQALRARLLAERGVLQVFPETSLDRPSLLAAALDQTAALPPSRVLSLALDGARRSAVMIADLARDAAP